jgi:hypothetical protein
MANNFPNLRPTLNLDMVNGIYVDPRVTFTRAGTRTFFGREMVKAEENLLLQSQAFDDAVWTKTAVTISANSTAAPDGTTTADTVTGSAGTALKVIFPAAANTGLASAVVTISIFAKEGTHRYIQVSINGDATKYVNFDLNGSGATSAFGSGVTSSVTAAANGFIRCVVSLTGHPNTSRFYVSLQDSLTAAREASTASTGDIFLWGAQTELRSSATAYTPTTTQPITRYQRQLKTAAANEWPREFDPVTGECLGRSVWESRTNLVLRSEDLSTTWANEESTESVNVAIAPDGTLTADLLIPNTNNVSHWIGQTVTATAVSHTFSFFAKAFGYSVVQVLNSNSGSAFINFDLSTGLVGSSSTYTGTMTSIGNGWYRCTATATLSAASAAWARVAIVPASTSARAAAFAGDGFSGVLLWGAQLEAGAFATPYIPTVASQITRLADSAVMTGTNFSSWFNPSEGSVFIDHTPVSIANGNTVLPWITSGAAVTNNGIGSFSFTSGHLYVAVNGAAQANIDAGTLTANAVNKIAFEYKTDDFSAVINGGTVGTDTSGTLPVVDRMNIGLYGAVTYNGYIKRLTYYPQALTAANLQAITR